MQTQRTDISQPASLKEILQAREERQLRQQRLLRRYQRPLISLSLNIAGALKQFPLARKTYAEAKRLMLRHLERVGACVVADDEVHARSGSEGCFAVTGRDAVSLKRSMVALEESRPVARLFDLDVLDVNGRHLSRKDLGLPSRRCLLCDAAAAGCARSQRHALDDVRRHTLRLMERHFQDQKADILAGYALRSLLYEVCVTPKPGLVDRISNGAHADMDIFTFMDSSSVLFPYFRHCALLGLQEHGLAPDVLFAKLRYPGMDAEDAMYRATGDINTHKGGIFSLGIVCAAAGRLLGRQEELTPVAISTTSAAMTAGVLAECRHIPPKMPLTNGLRLYGKGIHGARGEAASGFPSVLRYGLPSLERELAAGASIDRAGAVTLIRLMANVFDTNIISRSSLQNQYVIQDMLQGILATGTAPSESRLRELDAWFVASNISPGGCADLLGLSWMLYFLRRDTALADQDLNV